MRDRSGNQPDSPSGVTPKGAAGATGIIGLGQLLDDPWRTFVSITGPWIVWLVPILALPFYYWYAEFLVKTFGNNLSNDHKQQIQEELQQIRMAVLEKLKHRIHLAIPERLKRKIGVDDTDTDK